jgi:hypothetical protein
MCVLVEAQPGYSGTEHTHSYAEFQFVVSGELSTQGHTMVMGDAYAASAGSRHTEFRTETGATYFLVSSHRVLPVRLETRVIAAPLIRSPPTATPVLAGAAT